MKSWIFLVIILSAVLLSGCSQKTVSNDRNKSTNIETKIRPQTQIQNRKTKWDRSVSKVRTVERPFFNISRNYDGITFDQFKYNNTYVVEATILDFHKIKWVANMPKTKMTVRIDRVISGNKSIEGKRLYLNFPGGFARERDIYTSSKGTISTTDPDKIIFYKIPNTPLPEIGSKIITGLRNDVKHVKQQFDSLYISDVEHTFWVKRNRKFELNNPAFQTANRSLDIFKLTDELNKNIK